VRFPPGFPTAFLPTGSKQPPSAVVWKRPLGENKSSWMEPVLKNQLRENNPVAWNPVNKSSWME